MDQTQGKEFYKKILNDHELAELEMWNDRPAMQSAIKKIILSSIYYEGVLKPGESPDVGFNFLLVLANSNNSYTNEYLGADLKARVKAMQLLEMGYKELEKFKKITQESKTPDLAKSHK